MPKVAHVGGFVFKPDTDPKDVKTICDTVIGFKETVPGVLESYCGEFAHFDLPDATKTAYKGAVSAIDLNRGYTHGFYMIFESVEAREGFENADAHLKFGPLFTPHLKDNMNSVIVFDFLLPE